MGAAIFIVVVFGLLFAMLIIPRQREVRRHAELIASMAVGDEVMTGSGIYGTIRELDADFVHLEVAPGTVLKLARRAIASKVEEPAAAQPVDPADDEAESDAVDVVDATDDGSEA